MSVFILVVKDEEYRDILYIAIQVLALKSKLKTNNCQPEYNNLKTHSYCYHFYCSVAQEFPGIFLESWTSRK